MLLLDTHALPWLVRDDPMAQAALDAVEAAQDAGALYASPVTAWELGVADLKRSGRPGLGMAPGPWFRRALRATGARLAAITPAVAAEAAAVPAIYGRGDPGDCFLIATARRRRPALVTRDALILRLAAAQPSYVRVVECSRRPGLVSRNARHRRDARQQAPPVRAETRGGSGRAASSTRSPAPAGEAPGTAPAVTAVAGAAEAHRHARRASTASRADAARSGRHAGKPLHARCGEGASPSPKPAQRHEESGGPEIRPSGKPDCLTSRILSAWSLTLGANRGAPPEPTGMAIKRREAAGAARRRVPPAIDKAETLNFKVSPAFKKAFKGYAVAQGMSMVDLLREGFELSKLRRDR